MALADAAPNAILHWPLTEASGDALDAIGSNDLAETSGTIGNDTGIYAGTTARDFEAGDTEYLSRADNATLSLGNTDWMIRCWVKAESIANFPAIASKGWQHATTSNWEWVIYVRTNASNLAAMIVRSGGAGGTETRVDGTVLTAGSWHLLHVWHDAANNQLGFAVDAGTPGTASHSAGINDGSRPFVIGSSPDQSLYWDGLIQDFVVLQGYILDATERTADYNSGAGVPFADWANANILARRRRLQLLGIAG